MGSGSRSPSSSGACGPGSRPRHHGVEPLTVHIGLIGDGRRASGRETAGAPRRGPRNLRPLWTTRSAPRHPTRRTRAPRPRPVRAPGGARHRRRPAVGRRAADPPHQHGPGAPLGLAALLGPAAGADGAAGRRRREEQARGRPEPAHVSRRADEVHDPVVINATTAATRPLRGGPATTGPGPRSPAPGRAGRSPRAGRGERHGAAAAGHGVGRQRPAAVRAVRPHAAGAVRHVAPAARRAGVAPRRSARQAVAAPERHPVGSTAELCSPTP
ncbi:hypothetical protein JOE68_003924 [Saccharothrix algeriensis]|uniref:Uncharacterized protein n=1 Tax=Saccharothrix algeriensis TaxID=173560 RepID=A0ABS2SBQ4_9PSEU|nr:hypothetical protein [Saccharothrix algeriensis]